MTFFTTSWDDGNSSDVRLSKLLDKYRIKGTFYIPSNRELAIKDLVKISKKHEIGGHTLTHPVLTEISLESAREEIKGCKNWVEEKFGDARSFCYPKGLYNEDIVSIVKKAGFAYARTTERFKFDLDKNPLTNGTTCQTIIFKADAPKFLKINKLNPLSMRYVFDWLFFAKKMFNHALKTKGIFHLWGHSWEIEKYNQWKDLESFFKYVSQHKKVNFVTNADLIK